MAYDSVRNRTVLFGGNRSGYLGDTWEWNGATASWTQLPISGPLPRQHAAMAFDEQRGRMVLFGGAASGSGGLHRDDTWELAWTSGQPQWILRCTGCGPVGRSKHAMAYDSDRQRVVMFGGETGTGVVGGLWEWNGVAGTWELRQIASPTPSPRACHAMAYDSARHRLCVFGGMTASVLFADTWESACSQASPGVCYANCDLSTAVPVLTANDFQCFLNKFASGDPDANCDGSTASPELTANDFQCFLNKYAAGCP